MSQEERDSCQSRRSSTCSSPETSGTTVAARAIGAGPQKAQVAWSRQLRRKAEEVRLRALSRWRPASGSRATQPERPGQLVTRD
jgi:hypothetical protein